MYIHFTYLLLLLKYLSFAKLTGYAMHPVLLSDTVHTDSFTAHNNNNNNSNDNNNNNNNNNYYYYYCYYY